MLKADRGTSLTLIGAGAHIPETAGDLCNSVELLETAKQQCLAGSEGGIPALVMQARDGCSVCPLGCRLWHISCWRSARPDSAIAFGTQRRRRRSLPHHWLSAQCRALAWERQLAEVEFDSQSVCISRCLLNVRPLALVWHATTQLSHLAALLPHSSAALHRIVVASTTLGRRALIYKQGVPRAPCPSKHCFSANLLLPNNA